MSETTGPPAPVQAVIDRVPDDMPRQFIDGLSRLRIAASPPLTAHLLLTSPENRSWLMGGVAAAIASTDKLDGLGAKWIGSTDGGRDLDRRADRSFVIPPYAVLAAKGEIPSIHLGLKIAREVTMAGLRSWGAKHGKDLKSREVNRQKTTLDMMTIAAAHSPLSQNEDLMRWGASNGDALSLTGLIETIFDYAKKDEPEAAPESGRNSKAREVSAGPLSKLAKLIHRKAPGVTPSDITQWSKRLVETSAALAVTRPNKPALATILYIFGNLGDAVDGAHARERGEASTEGMIEDVQADLEEQLVTFGALSLIARKRGNRVAAGNYAVAVMTTSLSALMRAEAESHGHIVAEGGIGTRVGRGILGGVGMGLNKHRDISDIVSAMIADGNINTVLERKDVVDHGENSKYCVGASDDPELKLQAEKRKKAILPYAKAGLVAGSMLLALSQMQSSAAEASGAAA